MVLYSKCSGERRLLLVCSVLVGERAEEVLVKCRI